MSSFCTQCGRPLQDGEICTCTQTIEGQNVNTQQANATQVPPMQQQIPPIQQQVPPMQQQIPPMQQQIPPIQQQVPPMQQQIPPIQQQVPPGYYQMPQGSPNMQAIAGVTKQAKTNFLQLLKKPVTTGKQIIAEADLKMAAIFLVLQAVASSLFAIVVASKINSLISSIGGAVESMLGGYGAPTVTGALKLSYAKIFIVTFLFSLVFSCILALLLWLGHVILSCKTSYPKMLSAAAVRSSVMVPTILAALVLFELNAGLGFFLLITGNIWGFVTIAITLIDSIPEKKRDIFPLIISLAILIFIVVVFFVMSKEWTLYLPDIVKTAVEKAGKLISNPGQILQEYLYDMIEDLF